MKKKFVNSSQRVFLFVFVEVGELTRDTLTLEELFMLSEEQGEEFEYLYSLTDEIDTILDLKVNENIYIQGNRDNKHSKGVLTRIK